MKVSECMINETIYVCYNDIRQLNIPNFFSKKVKIQTCLSELGYTGDVVNVLYKTKDQRIFYIPEYSLENNTRARQLVVKSEILELIRSQYKYNFKNVKFDEKVLSNSSEKNKSPKITIIPPKIELDKEELFFYNEEHRQIKMYGNRTYKGTFFSCKDFSSVFNMENLNKIIKDTKGSYEYGIHYKIFYMTEEKNTTCLLLTFEGTLKILFTKKTSITTPYLDWVCKTLYSMQYGDEDDKNEVISEMLKITPEHLKHIFGPLANTLPALYLIKLGTKTDLQGTFELDKYKNKSCVYKFGYTCNLKNRLTQHKNNYAKIGIFDIEITKIGFVDPVCLSKAETEIKDLFSAEAVRLHHDTYEELVVLEDSKLNHFLNIFIKIADSNAGHTKELQDLIKDKNNELLLAQEKIKNLENSNKNLEKRIDELKEYNTELKETIKENKIELKEKGIEIRRLNKIIEKFVK